MSRTKRSFWKVSLAVFANVSHDLEDFGVRFCECLVRNAHFGRSLWQFLRMSRTKRSFWKVSLSVFANVSHETLLLEDCGVRFRSAAVAFISDLPGSVAAIDTEVAVGSRRHHRLLLLRFRYEGLFGCFGRTKRTGRQRPLLRHRRRTGKRCRIRDGFGHGCGSESLLRGN